MLIFNLKKQWFDKIKSGEKTHEYRVVKPYWTQRLMNIGITRVPHVLTDNILCEFVCGYPSKNDESKRLRGRLVKLSIINGKNTDLAVDKDVYDIEFEVIDSSKER